MSHYHFSIKSHGIMKNGQKINTEVHYKYICREGKYSKLDGRKEDLVYTKSGNLPVWACNNPDEFWKQAEANRGENNNGYRELLLGLQEELSLQDNIELVEKLLEKTGIAEHHVYTYAIHDKVAAFDKDHRNIHCHLMFNEKILEAERPLEAERFFKRYSVDNNGQPTQGYRVERKFHSKANLIELRQYWQDIVNEKLAQNSIDSRVDCRTLSAQCEDKIATGNFYEAQYFNRRPALHLGKGFQNPEEQRSINTQCEENLKDELNGETVVYPEPENLHEIKKVLFIRDFVVRKIAKILQEAKKEKLQKAQKLMDYAAYVEAKQEALVITNTDIIQYEVRNIEDLAEKIKELDKEYRELAPKIISDRKSFASAMYAVYKDDYLVNKNNPAQIKIYMQDPLVLAKSKSYQQDVYMKLAKEEFLGNGYKTLKKEYESARAEKGRLVEKYNHLKDLVYISRTPELMEERRNVYKLLQTNNDRTHSLAEKLKGYEEVAKQDDNLKIISDLADKISGINADNKARLRTIYTEKVRTKYALQQAENIIASAKELPTDTIVFAEKIHPLAVADTKLYGEIKLGSLKMVQINNETYCILPNQTDGEDIKAVKLFDDVVNGKLPVYKLRTDNRAVGSNEIKKSIVKASDEKVPVYKNVKNSIAELPPMQRANKENAILKAIHNAVTTRDIRMVPLWPEIDNTIVDEVERELEQAKIENYLRL